MKGRLIQINNVDAEPIGLWYTESKIPITTVDKLFREYDDSDEYDEKGIDGFEDFVSERGFDIERVFVENIML